MNWWANVVLARRISKFGLEVTDRAAVNRAYYGAFNLCPRWLEENVTPIENRGAHRQVWETFKTADLATEGSRRHWRLVGQLGDSLHQLRNQVDYEDRVDQLESRATGAVGSAERIVRLLATLEVTG